jgi:hypothetical protein
MTSQFNRVRLNLWRRNEFCGPTRPRFGLTRSDDDLRLLRERIRRRTWAGSVAKRAPVGSRVIHGRLWYFATSSSVAVRHVLM